MGTSIDTCLTEAPTGFVSNALDCNDLTAAANPVAPEIMDGIDNDCNGSVDDGDICPAGKVCDNGNCVFAGINSHPTNMWTSPPSDAAAWSRSSDTSVT